MTPERPNVVVVVMDTARADAFEPYGAPPGSSPAMAQLAASGSAATGCYAPACWTVPSHASMFAGLLPRTAGLGHVGGSNHDSFRDALRRLEDRLLPVVLHRAGYETAGVSCNGWINSASGFDIGFDEFRAVLGDRHRGLAATTLRSRLGWYLQALAARVDDGAAEVERLLGAWLGRRRRRPFFWFVNLIECHSPYLPPRPFSALGPVDRVRAAAEARRHLTLDGIWRASIVREPPTDDVLDRMRSNYASAIRLLDGWVARLAERLEAAGLLDSTQLIVTSDHGENLGDGCLLGHAFSLDDRLIRVPFVTVGPATERVPGGIWSLAALPSFVADAAEIDDHPWHESEDFVDGIAVAQFDAPGSWGDERVQQVAAAWRAGEEARRRLCTSFACATDGKLKLQRVLGGADAVPGTEGDEQLVVLADDPLEQSPQPVDAAAERAHGAHLRRLREALDRAAECDLGARAAGSVDSDERSLETAALEEQLRLLGYL